MHTNSSYRPLLLKAAIATAFAAAIGAAPAALAEAYNCQGRVRSEIQDYLVEGTAKIDYTLRCNGRRFKLEISNSKKLIPDGAQIAVRAKKVQGKNVLQVDADGTETGYSIISGDTAALTVLHTALIVRVNSLDGSVPCTEAQLDGYMWSGPLNTSKQFAVSSYNNVAFLPDADVNGAPDVITVSIPYNTAGACNYSTWGSAARAEAAKVLNVANFQHMMYVLPSNVNCGWAGLASVGGGYSYYHGGHCTWQPELFQHELGHNLGFHHSGTVSGGEYADHSCAMGNPSGAVSFNAAKRSEKGWLPAGNIAAGMGEFTLRNLMLTPVGSDASALKLTKASTGESYYVAYRQRAIPEEGGLRDTYNQKVTITRSRGAGSVSYLDAVLGVGQSFVDSADGLQVTVQAIDPVSQTATVSTAGNCTINQSQVQISPATQAARPGAARTYTVTVTNKDSAYCSASRYDLSALAPEGWAGVLSVTVLNLAPGQSGSAQLSVTASSLAAEGSYPLSAAALRSGETALTANALLVIDLTAPIPPATVSASISKQGSRVRGVNVACGGAVDTGPFQSGITGYKVYRNGALACTVNGSSCLDAITTAGTYTYTCAAVDGAGNESAPSAASAAVTIGGGGGKKR